MIFFDWLNNYPVSFFISFQVIPFFISIPLLLNKKKWVFSIAIFILITSEITYIFILDSYSTCNKSLWGWISCQREYN